MTVWCTIQGVFLGWEQIWDQIWSISIWSRVPGSDLTRFQQMSWSLRLNMSRCLGDLMGHKDHGIFQPSLVPRGFQKWPGIRSISFKTKSSNYYCKYVKWLVSGHCSAMETKNRCFPSQFEDQTWWTPEVSDLHPVRVSVQRISQECGMTCEPEVWPSKNWGFSPGDSRFCIVMSVHHGTPSKFWSASILKHIIHILFATVDGMKFSPNLSWVDAGRCQKKHPQRQSKMPNLMVHFMPGRPSWFMIHLFRYPESHANQDSCLETVHSLNMLAATATADLAIRDASKPRPLWHVLKFLSPRVHKIAQASDKT